MPIFESPSSVLPASNGTHGRRISSLLQNARDQDCTSLARSCIVYGRELITPDNLVLMSYLAKFDLDECMCGYVCLALHVWLCMYDYLYMAVCIWLCIYVYLYVWLCLHRVMYVCVYVFGLHLLSVPKQYLLQDILFSS